MVFIHTDILLSIQKLGGAWFSYTDILLSSRNQEEHGFNPHRYTSQHLKTKRNMVSIHTDTQHLETRRSTVSIHTDILLIFYKLGGAWFQSTQKYFSASINQEEHGFHTHRYSVSRNQEEHGFHLHRYTSQHLETRRSMVFIHTDILLSIQKLGGAWFLYTQIYFSSSRNQEEHGFHPHRYTSQHLETRGNMVSIHTDILLSIQKLGGAWFPSTQILSIQKLGRA